MADARQSDIDLLFLEFGVEGRAFEAAFFALKLSRTAFRASLTALPKLARSSAGISFIRPIRLESSLFLAK
jgi:hypothetical protein